MELSAKLKSIEQSKVFGKLVVWMIIGCSLVLGIETIQSKTPYSVFTFQFLDFFFTGFFTVEILIRLFAEKNPMHFFRIMKVIRHPDTPGKGQVIVSEEGFWNWFDLTIVVMSIVGFFSHFFTHPEFLMIARLFRIFRIFRLFEVSSQLKQIEKRIVAIIPTVFSFGLLLMILIYIYAIIGMYLFEFTKHGRADFSNLYTAFITLFQIMTLDGWSDVMNDVDHAVTRYPEWFTQAYFISFVVMTAIVTFNVFIAVLTSQVEERMMEDAAKSETKLLEEVDHAEEQIKEGFEAVLAEMKAMRLEIETLKNR